MPSSREDTERNELEIRIAMDRINSQISDVYQKGLNRQQKPLHWVTNTDLSLPEISRRVMNKYTRATKVELHSIQPLSERCQLRYTVDVGGPDGQKVLLSFVQCADPAAAATQMKSFLRSFDGELGALTRPVGRRDIGLCSLVGAGVLFFVRLGVFVTIAHPFDTEEDKLGIETLANAIDDYLSLSAVELINQDRPYAALKVQPAIVRASIQQEFDIAVDFVGDTHAARASVVSNKEIVFQTGNASRDGTYKFYACCEGETDVDLVLVHKRTFTLQKLPVRVVVNSG